MNTGYAVHRRVENAYLVRERDRRRLRELAAVLLVVVPLGALLLAYTWIHLEVLDTGYHLVELERQLHELERRESQLTVEATYLASPQRVEARAESELGMRPPEPSEMVFWGEIP